MNNFRKFLIWAIVGAACGLTSATRVRAQSAVVSPPTVEIIKRLPDKTLVLTVNGVEYHAVPTARSRKTHIFLQIVKQPIIAGVTVFILQKIIGK